MLVTPLPRWKNPAHGLGDDYGSYSLAQPTTLARPPQPQPQPYRGGAVTDGDLVPCASCPELV